MTTAKTKFDTEHRTFKKGREMWLTEGLAGQYVVIHGEEILGFYKNPSEAFASGIQKFGVDNFFMSSILPDDATNVSFFGLAV